MASYDKSGLIERTVSDDAWLGKAVLRLAHLRDSGTVKLSADDSYQLTYWMGVVRASRNLVGSHRDNAVAMIRRKDITDALWDYVIKSRIQIQN